MLKPFVVAIALITGPALADQGSRQPQPGIEDEIARMPVPARKVAPPVAPKKSDGPCGPSARCWSPPPKMEVKTRPR